MTILAAIAVLLLFLNWRFPRERVQYVLFEGTITPVSDAPKDDEMLRKITDIHSALCSRSSRPWPEHYA